MGNSLLDILVFGRRAGVAAAERARHVQPGRLTLAHVREYRRRLEAAGGGTGVPAPMLLPSYARPETLARRHGRAA